MAFTTVQGASASDATSFIGSAGVDSVNLNNVGTTVWLGAQGANDVISFESSTRSVSGYTLRGGQGQDRLSVSDSATSLTDSFINLNNDNDVMQLLSVSSSTIYGGAGSDTLLTGALSSVRFNSNKGDDTTTIAGATGSSIFGGQGSDTTTLNGDYSSSVIQGDNDNDTLTFSNASSLSSTTVNGNEGNDTINVNAITSFAASTLFGGQGNDSINAANSNVGVLASGDAGADALVGGTNNDSLLGGAGDDNILGNAGADSLIGGTGDDFFLYNTGDVGLGEVIDGGAAGANGDTILVQTTTDFANLTTATILTAGNIENIRITDGTTGTFLGSQLTGQAINVNGTAAAVSTLDVDVTTATAVDLSTLTFTAVGAGTAFTTGVDIVDIDVADPAINGTITGTTLADSINGNNGTDNLSGNAGNDTIDGGAANDTLTGGAANDSLTGGTGVDNFIVDLGTDSISDVGNGGADNINVSATATANATVTVDWTAANTSSNAGTATLTSNAAGIDISVANAVGANGWSLVGNTGNETLTGSAQSDTITGAAGADNLTGGAGADQFVYTTPANSTSLVTDQITDFLSGTDDFKTGIVGGVAGLTQGAGFVSGSLATLALSIDAAIAAGGGAGTANQAYNVNITAGAFAGQYVFIDADGDDVVGAAELVVQLTGTSSAALVAGDFIA